MTKALKRFYLALILLFLYLPIVVLIFQSFNAGVSRAKWEGFSLRWYIELFRDPSIKKALWVTVSIAALASFCNHTGHACCYRHKRYEKKLARYHDGYYKHTYDNA